MGSHALSVVGGDKDQSLQAALNNLSASKAPLGIAAEPIVTAVHRMPAVEAEYGPYPDGADDRLKAALRSRGVEQSSAGGIGTPAE